jgi:ATP-binding cassette, subfamily B, bacterial
MSSQKEYVIPEVNEKPTGKQILATIPFIAKFVFRAAPKPLIAWMASGILQVPLASASVFILKALIDDLAASHIAESVPRIVILLIVYAIMSLNQYYMDYQTDVLRYRVEYVGNDRTLGLMASLPFSVLERTEFRVLCDAFQRKSYVLLNIVQWTFWGMFYLTSALGLFTVIALLPWQSSLFLIVAIGIRIWLSKREASWSWTLFDRETREGRRANYIRSILTIPISLLSTKSWGLHQSFVQKWRKITGGLLDAGLNNLQRMSRGYAWTEILYIASLGVALSLLVRGIESGQTTIGSIAAFLVAFPGFWGKIGNTLSQYRMVQKESAFLVIARDFLSLEPEQDVGKSVPKNLLKIEFQDVHFSYPGSSEEVLRGINCSFSEGDRLALVGLNGVGKSTMLKLLMGIFNPTKGRILVNGVDLAGIKPSAWRRALSVMSQDVIRFDDTIREQILYGDYAKTVDEERLNRSVEASGLRTVLPDFKRGIETHAGKQYAMTEDEAIELSGGQNQIVGIARALYRDARMYIFDEPTSAVDPEKEENFFSSLPNVLEGKGIIFVSHRFSTLRQAEHIIVIDAGRVIEEGSHETLMEKKGRYAELFTLQAKAYQ